MIEHPPAERAYDKVLHPVKRDFDTALDMSQRLREAGSPVGTVDILIASMAINRNLSLITKDGDFEKIQAVEKKLKIEWVP